MACFVKSLRLRCAAYGFSLVGPAVFAALAGAQIPAAKPANSGALDKIRPQYYLCHDHNVRLPVTYIETAGGSSYAVLTAEGKQISMALQAVPQPAATAAAAAPADKNKQTQYYYQSLDEDNGYRWYPDGDKGRLTFLAADDGAKEETVYNFCEIAKQF